MKIVTSSDAGHRELKRSNSASAERPHLRLVKGQIPDKPILPPESPSVRLEISEQGREILSLLAERAEQELTNESAEETIALLVAEGIEEGFLE